jgi:hypothetical protein
MRTLLAGLLILCYGAALVLGFLGVKLPFGSAELSPLVQRLLFLSLGFVSLRSAFSHAVYRLRGAIAKRATSGMRCGACAPPVTTARPC